MVVGIISRENSKTSQNPRHSWIMAHKLFKIAQNKGLRSLSQRVFIRSWLKLVNMLVGIISQPSSKTSQIPHVLLNYGPWIVQNESLRSVFIRSCLCWWTNISTKFYNQHHPPRNSNNLLNPPGSPELWPLNCPKLEFQLSKLMCFRPVLIKIGEHVCRHNISTKFYDQPNSPCTPELWPLNCSNWEFTLSKSNSFHPVLIKLGDYVGGHTISTKFYNQHNPPGTPKLWPLNCQKLGFTLSKSKYLSGLY